MMFPGRFLERMRPRLCDVNASHACCLTATVLYLTYGKTRNAFGSVERRGTPDARRGGDRTPRRRGCGISQGDSGGLGSRAPCQPDAGRRAASCFLSADSRRELVRRPHRLLSGRGQDVTPGDIVLVDWRDALEA